MRELPGDREWATRGAWLRAHWAPLVFLLCALPTGLGVVLLTPIGETPDEPQHISRADGLLSGQIIGVRWPGAATAGVMMNAALFVATITEIDNLMDQPLPDSARRQARAVRWNDRRFGVAQVYCATQMVRYFPALYVPGALGIATGRWLGMAPLYSLFVGRGFMLLSFVGMGAAALRFARFGRPLLFTVLTLPMTLYLAGSFNLDGQIIGAAALAAALLTRRRPGLHPEWMLALLLLTLIACAKAPYIWLLFSCLAPLARSGFRGRLAVVAAAAALPPLWLWAARRASAWPWTRPPYHPGPLWPGSHSVWLTATSAGGNIAVLLAHPMQIFLLPPRSLAAQAPALWHQMIGMLGWEAVPLAAWQYAGWALALAASALAVALAGAGEAAGRTRGLHLILLLAAVLSIALSAYVTFTNLGDTAIDGLRGRYLLPVLPFLLFVLPPVRGWRTPPAISRIAAMPAAVFCLPAIIMAALDVYALPMQIYHMFRMAGP